MTPQNPRPSQAIQGQTTNVEGGATIRGRGTAAAVASSFVFPLVLTKFIASYASSNMNVAISSIAGDLDTTTRGAQTAITLSQVRALARAFGVSMDEIDIETPLESKARPASKAAGR